MPPRNPSERLENTEGHPPFALCVNSMPIAWVPYDTAIDQAAEALEQIRSIVPGVSGEFSVGLRRLDSKAMEDLPAACPSLVADAVTKIIKRKKEGEKR